MSKLTMFPDTVRGGQKVELALSRAELLAAVEHCVRQQGHPLPDNVRLDDVLHLEANGNPIVHHLRKSGACFFGHVPPTKPRSEAWEDFVGTMRGRSAAKSALAEDGCKPLEPLREADVVEIVKRVLGQVASEDPLYRDRPHTPRLWSHAEVVDAVRSVLADSGVVAGKPAFCGGGLVSPRVENVIINGSGRDAKLADLGSPEAAERLSLGSKVYNEVNGVLRRNLRSAETQMKDLAEKYNGLLAKVAHEVRRRETTEERLEAAQNRILWLEGQAEMAAYIPRQHREALAEVEYRAGYWRREAEMAKASLARETDAVREATAAADRFKDQLADARDVATAAEEREHQLERQMNGSCLALSESQESLRQYEEREHQLERRAEAAEKLANEAEQEAQVSRNTSIALRQRAEAAEAELVRVRNQRQQLLEEKARTGALPLSPDAAQVARDGLLETIALSLASMPGAPHAPIEAVRQFRRATGRDVVSGR